MITLESGMFGWDYVIAHDDGRTVLVQSDTDYPDLATTFGWTGDFDDIDGAATYLDDHIGTSVDDPGYFD